MPEPPGPERLPRLLPSSRPPTPTNPSHPHPTPRLAPTAGNGPPTPRHAVCRNLPCSAPRIHHGSPILSSVPRPPARTVDGGRRLAPPVHRPGLPATPSPAGLCAPHAGKCGRPLHPPRRLPHRSQPPPLVVRLHRAAHRERDLPPHHAPRRLVAPLRLLHERPHRLGRPCLHPRPGHSRLGRPRPHFPLLPRPPPLHPLPPPPGPPRLRGGHQAQGRPGRPAPLASNLGGPADRLPAGLPPPQLRLRPRQPPRPCPRSMPPVRPTVVHRVEPSEG